MVRAKGSRHHVRTCWATRTMTIDSLQTKHGKVQQKQYFKDGILFGALRHALLYLIIISMEKPYDSFCDCLPIVQPVRPLACLGRILLRQTSRLHPHL
jgi:hypothetical protein